MRLTRLNELLEEGKIEKGEWTLTPDHEIQFRREGLEEEIKLKGALVAAELGTLVISFARRQRDQKTVTRFLKLTGTWKTNAENQIEFHVKKGENQSDVLAFTNRWKVNNQNEIVYSYETTDLKRKRKKVHELVFKGHWEIPNHYELTYSVGGDSESRFRFRGAFETASLLPKKGELRYQIGIEIEGRRKIQTITLFGKWKFSKDYGIEFEMETGGGRRRSLVLTRDLFDGNGEAFLRFQKSVEESRLEAGARVRW